MPDNEIVLNYRLRLTLTTGESIETSARGTRSHIERYYVGRLMIIDTISSINEAGVIVSPFPPRVSHVEFLSIH